MRIGSRVGSRVAGLCCAAPATLAETVALQMMVAVSADTEVLPSLDLAHFRVVNLYGIRYYALLGQRHFLNGD